MRLLNGFVVIALAVALMGATAGQTQAFDRFGRHAHESHGHVRVIERRVYRPRYRYRLHTPEDPHRYRYEPRGYYPYYGSHYWRPRHEVRRKSYRFHQPRYYKSWGKKKRHWNNRAWHRRNHGRHRFWQW